MVTEDGRLLRQFVEHRSQEAIAKITGRYMRLVYGTCLRELHDAALAEDAAQVVFCVLARKAAGLRSHGALASWLFTTARVTARQMRKREQLRREREQQAFEHSERERGKDMAWAQIADQVNDAVAALGPQDREVVLLRFFDGLSLQEVGQTLGIAEDTARKRVARSVERLRRQFARDGFTASADALAALLSTESVQPEPLASAASLAQNALAPSAHTLQQTTEGVLRHMALNTLRLAATVTGLGVLSLTGSIYGYRMLAVSHGTGKQVRPLASVPTVAPAEAAFVYTLRTDPKASSPGTPDIALTISRQAGSERWDMIVPQSGVPQTMSLLMPAGTDRVLTLLPEIKRYTSLPLALLPPDPFGFSTFFMMRSHPSHGGSPGTTASGALASQLIYTYQIRDLGPESVGGTSSEHYAVTERVQFQDRGTNSDVTLQVGLWLAPGKGEITAADRGRLSPSQTVTMPDGTTQTRIIQGDVKALAALAGRLPMKMTLSAEAAKTVIFTLASQSTQPLAAADFQIPDGYQEITQTTLSPTAPKPKLVQPQ